MYISATHISRKKQVAVWERKDRSERSLRLFNAEYYFYADDEHGEYTTIFGSKVSRCEFDSSRELSAVKKQIKARGEKLWESDISPEFRVLSKHYYGKPAPDLNVTFFDIEVDYDPTIGFSSPSNPYAPINSIALLHYWSNKMVIITVPPDASWTSDRLKAEVDKINASVPLREGQTCEFIVVPSERELLVAFLKEIENSDVVSGWNSEFFDVPYTTQRIAITLDKEPISLEVVSAENSFTGQMTLEYANNPNARLYQPDKFKHVKKLDFPDYGQPTFSIAKSAVDGRLLGHNVKFTGRIYADYLALYKKYEPGERASYKLSAISDAVLVDHDGNPTLPKLTYEGSLADQYRSNFAFFIRYNMRDVEILGGFEDTLGYIGISNENYHLSTGLFTHIGGTIQLADGAIVNYCHHELDVVVNDMERPEVDASIDGALVLYPQVGLHQLIGSIDATSLYPSAIRSVNISPEMLIGQFTRNAADFEDIFRETATPCTLILETGESITLPANQWSEYLVKSVWAVSGFGTVFSQHKQGFIPAVLTDWFNKRKQYKKLMKQFDGIDDDKSAYYDRLQYVYKIKLNSLYGALTNLYFRFYDLRMGESTTATGRNILKHQCRTVSLIMDGKYDVDFPLYETVDKAIKSGYTEEEARKIALHGPVFNGQFQSESVVYGDTDSVYFKTHAKDAAQAAQIADHIARRINESFPSFMQRAFKCAPGFDNIIAVNREIVSDNGIFVDKKRYIIHIVDSEGKTVDKMKTMGLDTKKTTLPAHVSSRLNGFIESFLTGTDWDTVSRGIVAFKRELIDAMKTDVRTIGLPKGINGIEDYSQRYKHDTNTRLPGHVAAAIHYNKCLEAFGDKQSPVIMSGMKIKVFYLLGDHGKFTSIALPTDIEMIPKWFLESFRVDIDKHIERLVDNPLTNILKAIDKRCPTEQSMLIDEAWAAVPAGAPLTEIDMWG